MLQSSHKKTSNSPSYWVFCFSFSSLYFISFSCVMLSF